MVSRGSSALRIAASAAALLAAVLAAGCAEVLREAERGAQPMAAAGPVDLMPLPALTGGRLTAATAGAGVPLPAPGLTLLRFVRPVALAAAPNEIVVADAGLGRVFRLDPVGGLMLAMPVTATAETQIELLSDRRLLVIDGATRRISQFAADGQPLPALTADPLALGRPVDVVSDARGMVYVADALYRHVLAFHPAGGAFATLLPRDAQNAGPQALAGIALSPRGLLLLDAGCRCVLVTDPDGRVLGRFGDNELVAPVRIDDDGSGRVFVADDGARELRVFVDGKPVQSFAYRSFGLTRVTAMRVAAGTLYLAGADDGRIEVRRIVPKRGGGLQ